MNAKTYAKSIDRLVSYVDRYPTKWTPVRPIHWPAAVRATRDDLLAISAKLRSDADVPSKTLADVKALLTDPVRSPLIKRDVAASRAAVAQIRADIAA